MSKVKKVKQEYSGSLDDILAKEKVNKGKIPELQRKAQTAHNKKVATGIVGTIIGGVVGLVAGAVLLLALVILLLIVSIFTGPIKPGKDVENLIVGGIWLLCIIGGAAIGGGWFSNSK